MIIDARSLDQDALIEADLCIIGGGAAGITIALQFIGKPASVVLLESGGIGPDAATQSLYAGDDVGIAWNRPDTTRSRFLGGSTNCWGGWCRPLDRMDFLARPWISNSGWPFAREVLDPYYRRSHDLLQLGPFDYSDAFWSSALEPQKAALFPIQGDRVVNIIDQFSPPARFGHLYRRQLSLAGNVKVFLNANATEIESDSTALHVAKIHAATLNGLKFAVKPKLVVLATGGIENARLLLLSNSRQVNGLGNGYDLVGRYFTDHPSIRTARVRLKDQRQYRRLYDSTLAFTRRAAKLSHLRVAAHLAPSEKLQQESSLPNSRTYFQAGYFDSMSAAYTALKSIRQQLSDRSKFGAPFSSVVREIARNLPVLLPRAPLAALAVIDNAINPEFVRRDFYLETVVEPIPNPDSRISLSSKRDRLDMRQVCVDWRLTDQDRRNFILTHRVILDEMERQNFLVPVGPREFPEEIWPNGIKGCWHHMGTTRMHDNPKMGVVDAHCRVHSMANLYVAGSSVFPTFGSDIPTMTIVALALRLAETLQTSLLPSTVRIQATGGQSTQEANRLLVN